MSKLLVLDFDGTMTDAEAEGMPFTDGYIADVAFLCGAPLDEVAPLAQQFEDEIRADSDHYGWTADDKIVAPAAVDPYLRIQPIARKVFDHYNCFMDPVDRDRLLDGILYKYNYSKTEVVFQEGARDCLCALTGTETHVITNSHTVPVQNKIFMLGENPDGTCDLEWLTKRVFGRAQKYRIDDSFTAVPEKLEIPGLDRPVLLRRKLYHDVIDKLRADAGVEWSDVVVCGDIFELDLALPLAMGARVGLMVNNFTPSYERPFLAAHPRAALLSSVTEIPPFADLT